MAIKMIAIILAGVWLGRWLDQKFAFEKAYLTMLCSLLFVALAIYVFIRDSSK